jgi:hypothetical protein
MTITKSNSHSGTGFFEKIASVAVEPRAGLTVTKESFLALLKNLEEYEIALNGIKQFHATWFEDINESFDRELVLNFKGMEFSSIETALEKTLYAVPDKASFREIIDEARLLNTYEEFDWLTGIILGINAVCAGLLPKKSSIYIFLKTSEDIGSSPKALRFFRWGKSEALHIGLTQAHLDLFPVFYKDLPENRVSIIGSNPSN